MKKRVAFLLSLIMVLSTLVTAMAFPASAEITDSIYEEPEAPSEVYNMNIDWKYKKPDVSFPLKGAIDSADADGKKFYEVDYDDSSWEGVSIPHQVNASDSFTRRGSNQGDTGQYRGVVLYRKHFTVPESAAGKKVFVEFEGIYNAAYVWVNGQKVGYYEAVVSPFGFDLTDYVTPGQEAVIALANDSTCGRGTNNYYAETVPGEEWGSSYNSEAGKVGNGAGFQWNTHEFTPTQAGLVYDVNLYIKDQVYQTLPLYNNLKTTGNYIYADNFDIRDKKATINVKAEVRNETAKDEKLTLQVDVVKNIDPNEDNPEAEDHTKKPYLKYSFSSTGTATAAKDAGVKFETVVKPEVYAEGAEHEYLTGVETVDVSYIEASFDAENVDFWSTDAPHLYDVYTILKNESGEVIDVQKTTTGFRKVEYTLTDGLKINDQSVWLTGYAQRSSNEWAAIGEANDWLTDYDMSLLKDSGSNFIRWMHTAPRVNATRSTDKYGIVVVAPAGDKEADVTGRAWSQRVEAMRATMIRFRNSPSVIFWETGNNAVTAQHQQEMTDLKAKLDPDGGRYSGCRTISSTEQIKAAEYVGTMLNRHAANAFGSMQALNKYMPIVETEYHREESPRRVWDDFSPPDYDYDNNYKSDASTAGYDFYDFTAEAFTLNDARCYQEFYKDRVNGSSGNNYYAAAAALCWTDSNQHARTTYSENGRMSGRVDPIRLPKQSFYAYQVMQADEAKVHIVGHWSYAPVDDKTREEGGNYYYPIKKQENGVWVKTGEWGRRDPTKKTVYVIGSSAYISRIDLLVDGQVIASESKPTDTFVYSFENIDVTKGDKVEAVAYDVREEEVARDEIQRTGTPATIRLTEVTGKEGFLADGSDLMYYDVEVVDEKGNVCPLSYDKINFELTGDAKFMGGYNSGKFDDTSVIGKNYVYAECGINRVFIKAGRNAGTVTLKASMDGGSIAPVTVTISTKEYPEEITGGLTKHPQQTLDYGTIIDKVTQVTPAQKPLGKFVGVSKADWANSSLVYEKEVIVDPRAYTVTLNGQELTLKNEAYKPDDATGVICEVGTVLKAIKALGADFEYTTDVSGTITMTSKKGQEGIDGKLHTFVIKAGQTAIGYDGDPEGILTNAEIYVENGELMMEINALTTFIDGVSNVTDTEAKVNAITYQQQ